jgi:ribosomal protein S18 acetylase RimI-like enzyme
MIRPTLPDDTDRLVSLTQQTGVFKPLEIVTLREVLDDYHRECQQAGHVCVTLEEQGEVLGFAYFAPAAMTEQTWYLYWIAVVPGSQGRGLGAELLRFVEEDIRRRQGRVLFIETSSLPHYEATRRFYVKQNYDQEAVLREFYAAGDDMVVFRKKLA